MKNSILYPLIFLFLAAPLSGCLYSREIAHTRRDIERRYPDVQFDRDIVVTIGPNLLRTASWLADFSDEEEVEEAQVYLDNIRRIKVGVYSRSYASSHTNTIEVSDLGRFRRQGWELALKAQDDDELVWLLYREHRGVVRDLYLVVLDDEDLVLARVSGHLNLVLARAIEDHHELREFVSEQVVNGSIDLNF